MTTFLAEAGTWMGTRAALLIPLILTLWIAWGDVKTRRIPNYLTLGTALGGLIFNLVAHGLPGLLDGFLGMLLGFGVLFIPYLWCGMGAGDVKALAALGAWLGPWNTVILFCYMGVAGGLMAVGYLWWQGLLWEKIKRAWALVVNVVLCRPHGKSPAPSGPQTLTEGIPYGVAMALGMVLLVGVKAI